MAVSRFRYRHRARAFLLTLVGYTRRIKAWLRSETFSCAALSGESEYDISINADHTLSCNCNDQDGSGHLGDLDTSSFEEIFSGPRAMALRAELPDGRLPLDRCAIRHELRMEAPEIARACR